MDPFIFPTSFAQQRLWFLDQFDPGKSVFHLLYALRFDGSLNFDALKAALNEVVRRHESLRTSFVMEDGEPRQAVARELSLEAPVIDLLTLEREDAETQAKRWWQMEGGRPFDLAVGPLLRAHLLRIAVDDNVLVITMHHIISDGWSMGVFLRELATLYEAFADGRPSPLPELSLQYADYSVWQREWMSGEVLDGELAYWSEHLAGAPALLELATDRPRPPVQSSAGARQHTEVPGSLADRLRTFSRREGVTLFMTLLAAFDVLLWRYSGQDDIVVGVPFAGRSKSELEDLIGLFANTLPLRTQLSGSDTFRELVQRVRGAAVGAYAHQEIPFDKLVERLQPDRSLSHAPIFQVIFALENTPSPMVQKGVALQWLEVERGTARNDLSLFMSDKGAGLSAMWEYNTDLFDGETISEMMSSYHLLLEGVLENPTARISDLQIRKPEELQTLLTRWNPEHLNADQPLTIAQRFESQVELNPGQIAVICGDLSLTFTELNNRANQLAHRLQRMGVCPEAPVGVFLERSVETVIALLAILKAGGAYVPIDPGYPAERVAFMLEDSQVPILLTAEKFRSSLLPLSAPVLCLDDHAEFSDEPAGNPSSTPNPDHLAYIIYTSGSTGKPKGVEVTHRSVVHLFDATKDRVGFLAGDVWTVVHSYAFDFSVWEIWGCLLQGGTLVVVPLETLQSPADLFELICREKVTVLNQTPSALRELLAARKQALEKSSDWKLRLIVCGGDALDQELALELGKLEIPVWNFYGPTESTVWTTCAPVEQTSVCSSSSKTQPERSEPAKEHSNPEIQDASSDLVLDDVAAATQSSPFGQAEQTEVRSTSPSIGEPIRDLQVYLLDEYLQPVPVNVPGELFIGGAGLARGYSHRPDLTAEKFIPNQFSGAGTRLYRTGDLARQRRDGRIEFVGRIDNQVKLRGFRVELGEIEVALTEHPGVGQAVVVIREDHARDRRPVAYIVPRSGLSSTANDLRSHLRTTLPEYMIPWAFVTLDEIPLTPNKKVDRAALPAPDQTGHTVGLVAPRTPTEELLAGIWSQVLRVNNVGVHDDFFELGGHSLLATRVTSRIRETFNVDLPVRAIFENLTIARVASRIDDLGLAEDLEPLRPIARIARDGKLPLSFAQQRLWFLDQLEPGNPFYNIARALRLRGPLNLDALTAAINEIVRRHESLRTAFEVDEETPYQRIVSYQALAVPVIDLRSLPTAQMEEEKNRIAAEEVKLPFDLTQGPFLRAKLVRLDDEDQTLILTMHHIAADEWSLAILFRELTTLYDAFAKGESSPLAELPIQYADYAVWQRAWLQGYRYEVLTTYWRDQLARAQTLLDLPTDKPRPAVQSFRGAYEEFEMPRSLLDQLKELCQREGVTLFMTCLAGFQLLLSRFTGQSDLLVGTDVANRNRVETENLIGFFTNLLPLRARVSGDVDFVSLLKQVRETTLDAYAHQDLPFEKLVEELRPQRDPVRNPLVQILIVMQNPDVPIKLSGLEVSRFDLPLESSRFDVVLFLSEGERGLSGFWLYNPDLFERDTIVGLSRNYERLLEQIVVQPSSRVDELKMSWHRHPADGISLPTQQDAEATKTHRQDADATATGKMDNKDLQQSRLNRLRNIRRKGVDLAQAGSVKTGFLNGQNTLPLVIEPTGSDIDLPEWAASNREFLNEKLLRHGALLFRGFAIETVPEFEKLAGAICPELFGEYGDLPREEQGGKVYGSTPYPSDERILFHNESSHMHQWPMLIWFYCVQPAQQGGESPIIDCRRIYQELDPEIRHEFERKGLMYVRNFTDGLDVSWQDFFHTSDRNVVEAYCRRASIEFEWKGDNGLRTRQVGPAVVKHPQTGELVFFNQLQLHHISCLAPAVRESLLTMMAEEDLPRNVYYGDGTSIDASVMDHIDKLYQRLGVSFPWAKHDVLMLNNMLVAHSRNPYVGPRKIVVALGNLVTTE